MARMELEPIPMDICDRSKSNLAMINSAGDEEMSIGSRVHLACLDRTGFVVGDGFSNLFEPITEWLGEYLLRHPSSHFDTWGCHSDQRLLSPHPSRVLNGGNPTS